MNIYSKIFLGGLGLAGSAASSTAIYVNSIDFSDDIEEFVWKIPSVRSLYANFGNDNWDSKVNAYKSETDFSLLFPEHRGSKNNEKSTIDRDWLVGRCVGLRKHKSSEKENLFLYMKWCTTDQLIHIRHAEADRG